MTDDSKQIQIDPASRGIIDHFFCFVCDSYVWDCDHLIEERLSSNRFAALEGSKLHSFTYDGRSRVLEIEFRVVAPFEYGGKVPCPPPPRVIQYFNVPRYVFTTITRFRTARRQERYWDDTIQRRFRHQTVRTVCRLPRIRRFSEARLNRYSFDDYLQRLSSDDQQTFRLAVAATSGSERLQDLRGIRCF